MLITDTIKKKLILDCILYINYSLCFWKSGNGIKPLIDSNSNINIITSIYTLKLDI